jgi:hypothetical protein
MKFLKIITMTKNLIFIYNRRMPNVYQNKLFSRGVKNLSRHNLRGHSLPKFYKGRGIEDNISYLLSLLENINIKNKDMNKEPNKTIKKKIKKNSKPLIFNR